MFHDPHIARVETKTEPEEEWRGDLLKAIAVLDRDGWCQGIGCDDKGRKCVGGALYAVAGINLTVNGDLPAFRPPDLLCRVNRAISRLDDYLGVSHFSWNDIPGRTVSEVKAMLRAAAEQ